jgi:heme/copper-type cytochrome/quinol oxidase subunit 2
MCNELNREGKFCVGMFCIFGSLLLTASMLVGLGSQARKDENKDTQEMGATLMFAGGIIFIVLFVIIAGCFVHSCHRENNSGNDGEIMGPV